MPLDLRVAAGRPLLHRLDDKVARATRPPHHARASAVVVARGAAAAVAVGAFDVQLAVDAVRIDLAAICGAVARGPLVALFAALRRRGPDVGVCGEGPPPRRLPLGRRRGADGRVRQKFRKVASQDQRRRSRRQRRRRGAVAVRDGARRLAGREARRRVVSFLLLLGCAVELQRARDLCVAPVLFRRRVVPVAVRVAARFAREARVELRRPAHDEFRGAAALDDELLEFQARQSGARVRLHQRHLLISTEIGQPRPTEARAPRTAQSTN
mmetsp:Transcript_13806/g.46024  ORF Transcript_13806/g.46024 Transcript_13806/m.46024 type:complete len:269 (+) Transcript_13806:522-1328(+)